MQEQTRRFAVQGVQAGEKHHGVAEVVGVGCVLDDGESGPVCGGTIVVVVVGVIFGVGLLGGGGGFKVWLGVWGAGVGGVVEEEEGEEGG